MTRRRARLHPAERRAEVIIFDTSGSMGSGRKMAAAKEAAAAAVDSLDDGVTFAVIAGDHEAKLLWPQDGRSFGRGRRRRPGRRQGGHRPAPSRPGGRPSAPGSTWPGRCSAPPRRPPARHPPHRRPERAPAAPRAGRRRGACRGLFQCDCRGVGVDWEVEEMPGIATALLGTVDIVADPEDLAADFRAMISSSQARGSCPT